MYVPSEDLPDSEHSSREYNGTGCYNTGLYTNYVVPIDGGTFKGDVTVQGKVKAQVGFFQDSDINLKNVQDYIELNNSDIAKLPIFDFLWRNKKDKDLHSGTSA
jgi:hypothetical protein